jgi:hypothetical protein
MSTYWYAVSDARKEYIFCVGKQSRPNEEHVRLYLQSNGIKWSDVRLVSDGDAELEGVLEKTYREVDPKLPMLVLEAYSVFGLSPRLVCKCGHAWMDHTGRGCEGQEWPYAETPKCACKQFIRAELSA